MPASLRLFRYQGRGANFSEDVAVRLRRRCPSGGQKMTRRRSSGASSKGGKTGSRASKCGTVLARFQGQWSLIGRYSGTLLQGLVSILLNLPLNRIHIQFAVTQLAEHNLEAILGKRPYQQGRENALGAFRPVPLKRHPQMCGARGLAFDRLIRESETLRHSVALRTWGFMMFASFRAVEGKDPERMSRDGIRSTGGAD